MNRVLSREVLKLPPVIGHRGACGHAPENTVASIHAAASLGVSCVEFDVKLSADGKPVVFHDDTVDRTTSGHGPIAELSLAEIRELDAGSWFSSDYAGTKVPLLSEVIDLLVRYNLRANIEFKSSPGREDETACTVCEMLKTKWPSDMPEPLLSSFSCESLMVARDMLPTYERAFLIFDYCDDLAERARTIDAHSVHIWYKNLTRKQAGIIRDAGYALRSFTVNDSETAQRLFEWGLESVFSDFPDQINL